METTTSFNSTALLPRPVRDELMRLRAIAAHSGKAEDLEAMRVAARKAGL